MPSISNCAIKNLINKDISCENQEEILSETGMFFAEELIDALNNINEESFAFDKAEEEILPDSLKKDDENNMDGDEEKDMNVTVNIDNVLQNFIVNMSDLQGDHNDLKDGYAEENTAESIKVEPQEGTFESLNDKSLNILKENTVDSSDKNKDKYIEEDKNSSIQIKDKKEDLKNVYPLKDEKIVQIKKTSNDILNKKAQNNDESEFLKDGLFLKNTKQPKTNKKNNIPIKEENDNRKINLLEIKPQQLRTENVAVVKKASVTTSTETLTRDVTEFIAKEDLNKEKVIEIKLNPRYLGEIKVKINLKDGEQKISITASEDKTHNLIAEKANDMGNILEKITGKNTEIMLPEFAETLGNFNHKEKENKKNSRNKYTGKKEKKVDFKTDFSEKLRLGLFEKGD